MNFEGFEPCKVDKAKALAVLLHGFGRTGAAMEDLKATALEAFGEGVDAYVPTLPYSNRLDWSGANNIVDSLVADLDEIWRRHGPYEKVVFIGHSAGGVLLRRLFLAGSPRPPDYAGEFAFRDDLPASVSRDPATHGWAAKVERIILIATWDKGWSISEREGWRYWFVLNLLGLLGHISPTRLNLAGTMFDLRCGAPFIVQTRLLWLAYRRWHNPDYGIAPLDRHEGKPIEGVDPTVVQIIGSRDDFVTPEDQVDNDVNGALPPDSEKARYFLLEMANTDHDGAIKFADEALGAHRREIFRVALIGRGNDPAPAESGPPRPLLKDFARGPALFKDSPTRPERSIKNVVFVMHGIRDDGYWTHRIARAVKEAASPSAADDATEIIHSLTPTYGYFAMLPFVLPWIRRQKVEWFMDMYVNAKACFPNATMHYVGHSNGTYLATRALRDYAAARFGRIYFAGSVVRTDYPWPGMVKRERVERFHNARGATDWVVALLPKSVDYCSDLGGAGFDGFGPPTSVSDSPALTQSTGFALGGHGGAITEPHWPGIAKYILTGEKPPEPPELFVARQHSALSLVSRLRVGLPLIVVMMAFVVLAAIAFLFPCAGWTLDATKISANGGWRYSLAFVGAFVAVLASAKWSSSGWRAWVRIALLVIGASGFGVWFLATLWHDFANCQPLWAAIGFTLLLALLRFVTTKF
jgi:alpha-beta hydrolase superfamily lysophospholipase